jgi:hypothetical protein
VHLEKVGQFLVGHAGGIIDDTNHAAREGHHTTHEFVGRRVVDRVGDVFGDDLGSAIEVGRILK